MKLHITCKQDENGIQTTEIIDSDTGEMVEHVRFISFVHEAGKLPYATIEVYQFSADVEIEAELTTLPQSEPEPEPLENDDDEP
jgi:hypothetical protein